MFQITLLACGRRGERESLERVQNRNLFIFLGALCSIPQSFTVTNLVLMSTNLVLMSPGAKFAKLKLDAYGLVD